MYVCIYVCVCIYIYIYIYMYGVSFFNVVEVLHAAADLRQRVHLPPVQALADLIIIVQ